MKVLGGPKEGDFYHHRGFRGLLGEQLERRTFTPADAAPQVAALAPVAEVMAQEAAVEAELAQQPVIPEQRATEVLPVEAVVA